MALPYLWAICLLKTAALISSSSFLPYTPGREWKMVGYLDMTNQTHQCPDSWQMLTSPRSCGKKSSAPCDSWTIPTYGASYQKVCGRFRGYEVGTPDAFHNFIPRSIETYYVDGVTVSYGSPGSRHHVYTYAAGFLEATSGGSCPCAGGSPPASLVGSDYCCESGNPGPGYVFQHLYSSDVLWDRQQCGGDEVTCCNPPDIPWFCKTFPIPISEDLEVRICTDEDLYNENVAVETFELHVQVANPLIIIQAVSVLNPDNTLRQIEISWIPVGGNMTIYTLRVVGADGSIGQGCTVCTTSPCLYVHQVTHVASNYSIFVTAINQDGSLGSQNSTTFSPTKSIFKNASSWNESKITSCSFQSNQSFYCVVCCSTDPSVPSDSSVYNISTTRGTEVTVSLQGLTSGPIYYCKAAASNTNSTCCACPVVGREKKFFNFVASLPPTSTNTLIPLASIDMSPLFVIIISTSLLGNFSLIVLVAACVVCMVKMKSKVVHQPALQSVHEMEITEQKKLTAV